VNLPLNIFRVFSFTTVAKSHDSKSERAHNFLLAKNKFQLVIHNIVKKERQPTKNMKTNNLTIYYALGAALLASIQEISVYGHSEEIDDFQIDVDQEALNLVCYYLLVDTTIISLVYHSFLLHPMLISFGFRYDPNFTR
jgi:hypothetical protein